MKKRILDALLCIAFMLCIGSVSVMAADVYDFENMELADGASPTGCFNGNSSITSLNPGWTTTITDAGGGKTGKAYQVSATAQTDRDDPYVRYNAPGLSEGEDKVTFEFSAKAPISTYSGRAKVFTLFRLYNSSGTLKQPAYFEINKNGKIQYYDGSTNVEYCDAVPGRWYKFAVSIDLTNKTADLYLNDEHIFTETTFLNSNNITTVSAVNLYFSAVAGTESCDMIYCFDDIRFYKGAYDENSDESPVIEIPYGSAVDVDALENIEISAYAPNGSLELLTVYVDGVKHSELTQPPFVLNLECLSLGTHTVSFCAIDNAGLTTEKEWRFIVRRENYNLLFEQGFEESSVDSGIGDDEGFIYSPVGLIDTVRSDEKGNYLELASDTECADTPQGYIGISVAEGTEAVEMQFDFCFADTVSSAVLTTRGKKDDGNTAFMNNITFVPSDECMNIRFYNGADSYEEKEIKLEAWHTLRYCPDFSERTYTGYLDGEVIVRNAAFTVPEFAVINNLIRFHITGKHGMESIVKVDNFSMKERTVDAIIESVTGALSQPVGGEDEIFAKFSAKYKLSKNERFILMRGDEVVEIAETTQLASDRSEFSIKLSQPLIQNNNYRLILTGGESDISFDFTTPPQTLKITKMEISHFSGTADILMELENMSSGSKTINVILNIYEDGKFKKSKIGEAEVETSAAIEFKNTEYSKESSFFELFVLDDNLAVDHRIYRFK